jgi:hypothetical protein
MATRKPRKFAEGDYIEDDAVLSEEQNAKNTADAAANAPAKTPSFKEAFAAARGAGDKTFEWGGKKFTTEMAKPKAAVKATPKVNTLAPADKNETRKALPLKSTKSETGNKFMGSTGLKSGGSVKGWGAARGARKAKVY